MRDNRKCIIRIAVLLTLFAIPVFAANTLQKIGVIGNTLVDKDVVLLAVKAKLGSELTEELIQDNMKLIYELGYFSNVGAEIEDLDGGKYLIFKVKENAIVKSIDVIGNKVVPLVELNKLIKTKIGNIFNIPLFNADVKRINDFYKDKGYVLSQVSDVKVDAEGASLKLSIVEGKLEEIRVEGSDSTKDWVILREFEIKPGNVYNAHKIRKSLQKVFNLGYFETVKPSHLKGKNPDDVILVVSVTEQRTGQASFGGGYSSSNGFVGFVQVAKKNFQGRGQTLNVKTEFGGVSSYELGFMEPWFRRKPVAVGLNLYNTKINREQYDNNGSLVGNYDESRKGGAVSVGKKLAYFTTGTVTFRDEKVSIDANIPGYLYGDEHLQSLGFEVSRDTRDNPFQPTSGLMDSIGITKTGGFLMGPNNYSTYQGMLRRYFQVKPKNVVATRLSYGIIDLTSGDVPEYELFGLGGSSNLRGYKNREYSGREMLYSNTEFRHMFTDKFTGILFYDAGDVNKEIENHFSLNKSGVGLGVSVKSPIGQIRLDYGKGNNGRGGRTYFSMGDSF
ncbi:MAG: BamA/TamA family outer membrane protein [Candidatus Wallbacteria bacterium]|nr:BamA/TamA family outer membrane protein [Candidatus Wallbacteria bacterium]